MIAAMTLNNELELHIESFCHDTWDDNDATWFFTPLNVAQYLIEYHPNIFEILDARREQKSEPLVIDERLKTNALKEIAGLFLTKADESVVDSNWFYTSVDIARFIIAYETEIKSRLMGLLSHSTTDSNLLVGLGG